MVVMGSTPGGKELEACMAYFNSRPEELTAIVKHRTSIKGHLGYLFIASVDPNGKFVTVFYHPPPNHEQQKLDLEVDPPLKNPYALRPRLMQYRDEGMRRFGVPAAPQITYYSPPSLFPFAVPFVLGLMLQFYALFAPGPSADWLRYIIADYFGKHMLLASAIFAGVLHLAVEPAFMFWTLRKHKVPYQPAVKWMLTVVAVGYAAINELWNCVEYEKLRLIYAQTDVGQLPPKVRADMGADKKTQ